MKAEELIDGKVYGALAGSNNVYFFRCKHPNTNILYLHNNRYSASLGSLDTRTNSSFKAYRECTEDEIIVFDASEKAKTFVSLDVAKKNLAPKIVDNYTLI